MCGKNIAGQSTRACTLGAKIRKHHNNNVTIIVIGFLSQVDWSKRYDACHKMLPRLSPGGIREFIDSATFSESAVNNISAESRLAIVKRALKFARQQDAALTKKGISDTQENRLWSLCVFFGSQLFLLKASKHLSWQIELTN